MQDRGKETDTLREHVDARFDELERLIKSGFPDGDLESHRKQHEGVIAQQAERAAMWRSIREKTAAGAVWSVLILMGNLLLEWVRNGGAK